MSFEINQIKNQYLQAAANASDNNGDGIINKEETSIFLQKSSLLKREGLITSQDIENIKDILAQNISINENENLTPESQKLQQQRKLEFDLIIHKKKLENLKNKKPKSKSEKRTKIIEAVTTTATSFTGLIGGGIAVAKAGAIAGSTAGPIGIAIGALAGMILGTGIGIYAGNKIGNSLTTPEEIQQEEQQYQDSITEEENIIKTLESNLEKLQ